LIHDDHVRSSDVSGKSNNQDLNVLINIEDTDTKANCAPPPKGGVQHNPPPKSLVDKVVRPQGNTESIPPPETGTQFNTKHNDPFTQGECLLFLPENKINTEQNSNTTRGGLTNQKYIKGKTSKTPIQVQLEKTKTSQTRQNMSNIQHMNVGQQREQPSITHRICREKQLRKNSKHINIILLNSRSNNHCALRRYNPYKRRRR